MHSELHLLHKDSVFSFLINLSDICIICCSCAFLLLLNMPNYSYANRRSTTT